MSAVSPLALSRCREVFAHGPARVPYRRGLGVALALGAPAVAETVRAFAAHARELGTAAALVPVEALVAETGPTSLPAGEAVRAAGLPDSPMGDVARAAGLRALPVGEVGRVKPAAFRLRGRRGRKLRQARDGLLRAGWRFALLDPPHGPALLDALERVSLAWLAARPVRENRVAVGWFDRDYLAGCPLAVTSDSWGRPVAFLSLFESGPGELAADLMRHVPNGPNGVMDFTFVSLIEALAARGVGSMNLGLAPLTGTAVERARGWSGLALRALARHRFAYDCRGLRAFKEKFRPEWSPAYLLYSSTDALPAIFWLLTQPVPRLSRPMSLGPDPVVVGNRQPDPSY